MKIVVCANLYPIGGRSGAMGVTDAIRKILQGVRRKKLDVKVFRLRSLINREKYTPPNEYIDDGILVYDFPIVPFASFHIRCASKLISASYYKYLEESDVIVCHMADQAYELLKLYPEFAFKVIYVVHANDVLQPEFMNFSIINCNKVLLRADSLKSIIKQDYHYKIDGTVFSGIDLDDRCSTQYKKRRVLYAGALIERKNVHLIISAVKRLKPKYPDLQLEIIGDGPEKDKLERLADDCVRFLGSLKQADVFASMWESEVFIMPSERETLGLVYLEAMNRFNKVIGTKGQGIDGIIIDGKNGFLIDNLTVEGVKEKIEMAFLSEDEISINARETSKNFSYEASVINYLNLITLL